MKGHINMDIQLEGGDINVVISMLIAIMGLVKEERSSPPPLSSEYQIPIITSIITTTDHSAITHMSQIKSMISFYSSATYGSKIYGSKKVFMPRWIQEYSFTDPQYFTPYKWTYLYGHSPLIKTLEKYVDFNRLQPGRKPNSRLLITAVNVLTAEPLIFDSSKHFMAI
jgi:hypothetical protein